MYALSRSDYNDKLPYLLLSSDPTDWTRSNEAVVEDKHVCYWTSTYINPLKYISEPLMED